MLSLNLRITLSLALLALPACPTGEKVGENPTQSSDGSESSSGTTTAGPTTTEPTTTDGADATTTESSGSTGPGEPGSTTIMGGGPPSECGPPCAETWTHVGDIDIDSALSTDEYACMTRVVGDIHIRNVDQQQLSGLRNLVSVEGILYISPSDTLTDLSPFSCVEEAAEILLSSLFALDDLSGLSALRRTERFHMSGTAATKVPSFSPEFSGLKEVTIGYHEALVDLAGMDNWKADESGVQVDIRYSPSLTSVAGLQPLLASSPMPLTRITLADLPALASLAGLEGLTELLALELRDLPLIKDLAPLGQLKTIGTLDLSGMPLVEDLQPLSQLETAERLTLGFCPADGAPDGVNGMDGITSLAGLSALTTLGEFGAYGNEKLATLAGADNLTNITDGWAELDNPALAPATVAAFAAQVGQDACSSSNPGCVCYIDDTVETGGV